MSDVMCKKGCYNISKNEGKCPENCEHGAWNYCNGETAICGAECLDCGGDLYFTSDNRVYCTDCGYKE